MGELTYFLGLQINQAEEGTFISQTKYCLELHKKFDMKDLKSISTPMASNALIDKYERGVDFDITKYRGIIRYLLYLAVGRLDIMFSVCMCVRYESSPKESHFKIVKRILRYLNSTSHHGLWYPKDNAYSLVGFSDSDFAGCKLDRKITSVICYLFDYDLKLGRIQIKFDSTSAISFAKNLVACKIEIVVTGADKF
ncbi:uncharacterized mitochondrial protein AtMg00810-like [Lathyrus oleraceus]|uniref:uncharacterized mitochondrial protein AtMg00810-like n=1 Tax=Pisum sativum TaxID=3888 RepID=UPI0021D27907|nr:uncharacterized mitochondrial protein AtMg00810-like [Pisum sativum]